MGEGAKVSVPVVFPSKVFLATHDFPEIMIFRLSSRQANEKLGNKIREQSKAIVQLAAEKE